MLPVFQYFVLYTIDIAYYFKISSVLDFVLTARAFRFRKKIFRLYLIFLNK